MGVERYSLIYLDHTTVSLKEFSVSDFTVCRKHLVHCEFSVVSLLYHSNIAVFFVEYRETEHVVLVLKHYGLGSYNLVLEPSRGLT